MSANAFGRGNDATWPFVGQPAQKRTAHPELAPLLAENVGAALAERSSRRVLATCVEHARSVKDISAHTGLPLATVYRHVHRLMDLGVMIVERSAMTPEGKKYDLYRSRVREAHLDLSGEHEEVRWVANEAVEARLVTLWDAVRFQLHEE